MSGVIDRAIVASAEADAIPVQTFRLGPVTISASGRRSGVIVQLDPSLTDAELLELMHWATGQVLAQVRSGRSSTALSRIVVPGRAS